MSNFSCTFSSSQIGTVSISEESPNNYKLEQKLNLSIISRVYRAAVAIIIGIVSLLFLNISSYLYDLSRHNWKLCWDQKCETTFEGNILYTNKFTGNVVNPKEILKFLKLYETFQSQARKYQSDLLLSIFERSPAEFRIKARNITDRELVFDILMQKGELLEYFPRFSDDEEVVLEAVLQNSQAIEWASNYLKQKKSIMEAAVEKDGLLIFFNFYTQDVGLVKKAVTQNGMALGKINYHRDNQLIVKIAVSNAGMALQYASDTLKNTLSVVQLAVDNDPMAYQFASPTLKLNPNLAKAAVKNNGRALQFVPDQIKTQELVELALENCGSALPFAPDNFKDDWNTALSAVKKDPNVLKFVSARLKNDNEFLREVSKHVPYPYVLAYGLGNFKESKEFMLMAVEQNPLALSHAHHEMKRNFEVVERAVTGNPDALQSAGPGMRRNPKLLALASRKEESNYEQSDFSLEAHLNGNVLGIIADYFVDSAQVQNIVKLIRNKERVITQVELNYRAINQLVQTLHFLIPNHPTLNKRIDNLVNRNYEVNYDGDTWPYNRMSNINVLEEIQNMTNKNDPDKLACAELLEKLEIKPAKQASFVIPIEVTPYL